MRESPSPQDPERLLRRLEWTVVRRLDGLLHGDYRSLFRGNGLDLAELREYQPGDDVRRIDWNVTARLQTPYRRDYHEDRDSTAWFLVDLSRSIDFGASTKKRAMATGFVAVLARLLSGHGNRVGALIYGNRVETMIPARAGRRHVLHLLARLTSPADGPARATKLGELLGGAANVLQRRSAVFVVSDFISEPGWEKPLAQLARRHDVVAVRVAHPLESELPDLGFVALQDAESGEQIFIDTGDRNLRQRFATMAASRAAAMRASFARAGIGLLELSTEEPLLDAIVRFAAMRKRRRGMKGSHDFSVA
jgi:uncharacterized protein (DUF58 family)